MREEANRDDRRDQHLAIFEAIFAAIEGVDETQLLLAALGALASAAGISARRIVVAKKAALDFISAYEIHNQDWLKLRVRIKPILSDNKRWRIASRIEKQDVLTWLNHHEIIAIAIARKVMDRRFYFKWFGTTYREDWKLAEPFVKALRSNGSEKYYKEFELQAATPWRRAMKSADTILTYLAIFSLVFALLMLLLLAFHSAFPPQV